MNLGLSYFIPDLISVGLLAYFLFEAVLTAKKDRPIFNQLAVGTVILAAALFFCSQKFGTGFGGMVSADPFAFYFKVFFTAVFFVITFMCRELFAKTSAKQQEFGLILWCPLVGLYFLASASHLLVLFIALEILTMALYMMATYGRHFSAAHTPGMSSVEAGLKYLLLGSIASGFTIFGIALLYMQTGALSFTEIAAAKQVLFGSRLGLLALLFIFAGLGFKIAVFPFQLWVPDVYQGAPAPVSAFMSVASKAAGFLLIIRFFNLLLGPLDEHWKMALAVMSILSLLYGNLGALAQTSFKRLMGYSSIGHAGYLLLAVASGTDMSGAAILYYFTGYAASTLAVFYVITLVEKAAGSDSTQNFEGLSKTSPFLSTVLFIALLSLAGIPPLAGFMGKFWILFFGLQAGLNWLVIAGLAMVVVGLYYYLSIAVKMIFREPRFKTEIPVSISSRLILIALTFLSLSIGLLQAPLMRIAATAIRS